MRGRFITFEGGEGTGKSTHAALLARAPARARHRRRAHARARRLARRRDRSATSCCRARPSRSGPQAEAILFAAARDDHVRNTIEPALARGALGDLRPLHRFDPRLSGRARRGRSAADPRARARHRRRPQARSHLHPRRAGRGRAGARRASAAATAPPTASRASRSSSTSSCATPIRMLATDEPDRCVLIDATGAAGRGRRADLERASTNGSIRRPRRSRSRASHRERLPTRRRRRARRIRARPRDLYRPCRGRADAARRLSRRAHAACLADRRAEPASARRRSPTAWRASCSRIPIRRAPAVQTRDVARGRGRSSGRAAHRGAGASRSAGAGAHDQREDRQAAHGHPGRRRPPHGAVLRLDRGRGRLAGRASSMRSTNSTPQGANALLKILEEPPPRALLLLVSHAPARVLPTIRSRCRRLIAASAVGRRGRRAALRAALGRDADDAEHREPRRRSPTAASARALALLDGDGAGAARAASSRCSTGCRRSIRARCTRSATRSAAPSRSACSLRRHRQRLAGGALAPSGPQDDRAAGAGGGGLGQGQPAPRATPRPTISTASRWFSRCSAGLPRPRAVDT